MLCAVRSINVMVWIKLCDIDTFSRTPPYGMTVLCDNVALFVSLNIYGVAVLPFVCDMINHYLCARTPFTARDV